MDKNYQKAKHIVASLLDVLISVYLILIIAVMPLYFTDGFAHIGTDKADFFQTVSSSAAGVFLLVTILYLIVLAMNKEEFMDKWKTLKKSVTMTDIFALLYGVSLVLSYIFTDYKFDARWGVKGWYMGLLPQLFLLMIYFVTSRLWKPKKWVFFLFFPISGIVFLLGYLNRFGIYPFEMKNANAAFISTIGNINWYCGYLVSVFFLGVYLLWQLPRKENNTAAESAKNQMRKNLKRGGLFAYVAIGFATLVTQGSVSGIVALSVVLLVMFCLSAKEEQKMRMFWIEMLLLAGVCQIIMGTRLMLRLTFEKDMTYVDRMADLLTNSNFPLILAVAALIALYLISKRGFNSEKATLCAKCIAGGISIVFGLVVVMIVVNTIWPGSLGPLSKIPLFTFDIKWGSYRGATWTAGWMCFAEQNLFHKLIGVGPDAMSSFLYRDGSEKLLELVRLAFGRSPLTNAHNEWITILVNTGILGCVSFVGMIGSAIVRFLKKGKIPGAWRIMPGIYGK